MSKQPKLGPKAAVEALVAVVETVLPFRVEPETAPTLGEVARVVGQASRLLRISDADERITVENQATVALAKKRNLMG